MKNDSYSDANIFYYMKGIFLYVMYESLKIVNVIERSEFYIFECIESDYNHLRGLDILNFVKLSSQITVMNKIE